MIGWAFKVSQTGPRVHVHGPFYDKSVVKSKAYPWAATLSIMQKPSQKVRLTGLAHALRGAEKAQVRLNQWEARHKHCEYMVKKWKAKLRYYDTRVAKLSK